MPGPKVPGGIPPVDGLLQWAPTSKPYNARTIGDIGPGRITGGSQGQGAAVIDEAIESPAPVVKTLAALGHTARTRNCKALITQFNAPAQQLGATGLWAYMQQVLPGNPDRKMLRIGNPWSHGDPQIKLPVTITPGAGGVGFAFTFNQGPTDLTRVMGFSQLNTFLASAYVPIGNDCYEATQFDLPPTDPVTIICWQNNLVGEALVIDVNCNVIEGT